MNIDNTSHNSERCDILPNRYNLNWQLCNEELGSIDLVVGLGQKNIAFSIARFFLGAVRSCVVLFRPVIPKKNDVLFFVSSENQYTAIETVARKVNNSSIVEISNPFAKKADAYFPLYKAYFIALLEIKYVVEDYRNNKNDCLKKAYRSRGDLLALAPGLLRIAISYLQSVKPRVVVVSNDLVLWTRAIAEAAKKLGIKTVYTQHSSVSGIVPPLEVDYAFLDGRDAARKYINRTVKCRTKIYLTGGPRHDSIAARNMPFDQLNVSSSRVGLCINMVDKLSVVRHIAKVLSDMTDQVLTIRPHPREPRTQLLRSIAHELGVHWSDPSKCSTVEFIDAHDTIVAGDSSILLEAALGNKRAISVQAMGAFEDFIGLISSGIVLSAKNDGELRELLKSSFHAPEKQLAMYYAPIGTGWEGYSSYLVASAINELVLTGKIINADWALDRDKGVYQLLPRGEGGVS